MTSTTMLVNSVLLEAVDHLKTGDLPSEGEGVLTRYVLVNALAREAGKVKDKLRPSMLKRIPEGADGTRGIAPLTLEEGPFKVEVKSREVLTLDQVKAEEVLDRKKLRHAAVDLVPNVEDPIELVSVLRGILNEVAAKSLKAADAMDAISEALDAAWSVEEVLSEEKIKVLVAAGKLDAKDVSDMFDVRVTHAFYGNE